MNKAALELEENYELYNKLKNENRKELLLFIYEQPRTYKDLIEFSQLKPGSLYHHLGILDPLIEKIDHGLYKITSLGEDLITRMNFISSKDLKPSISTSNVDHSSIENLEGRSIVTSKLQPDRLEVIWLSSLTYVNIIVSLSLMIILSIQGIAIAGSAIYAIGGVATIIIDLLALTLGIGVMYFIEEVVFDYSRYERLKFITFIRIISMAPGVIVGMTLYLLYLVGFSAFPADFTVLFSLSIVLGTIVAASGIHFLRGLTLGDSLIYASVPAIIDLLIGVVVLTMQ